MQLPQTHTQVISFSGGADSTAMLIKLDHDFPDVKKHVVFADTGWEHQGAEDWCRYLVEDKMGHELHVVRSDKKDFFKMVILRRKFPSPAYRQCTSDLKRGPIYKWIRNNVSDENIVQCIGLRAEESSERAKKNPISINNKLTIRTRTVYDYLPIHDWKKDHVRTYIKNAGLPIHPVYQWLDRFSCRVCIYMTPKNLLAVLQNDPEAIKIIAELEEEINFTMFPKGNIYDAIRRAQ